MEALPGLEANLETNEDRYSRLRLIPWWDQARIAACRVLVIGAGALGNEILKNLALLGFRRVVIVDLDRIELTNLSRTVLYRADDIGEPKAFVAARAYRALMEDALVQPLDADVVRDCGLGIFEWADVILAGLDNREARLWINRAAWKVGRPWIDGAIEGINGVARVFLPGKAPCYECTLGEVDWAILERRMSCNLLAHRSDAGGKVPTTPTISSIIAGIQVQEAAKLLHGLPTLASRGFVFEGLNHTSYTVEYTENPDCMSHYTIPELVRLPEASSAWTVERLWQRAQQDLGSSEVTLEFSRDVIWRLACAKCGDVDERFAPVGSVHYDEGACPRCGARRVVETIHGYDGSEPWGRLTLDKLGLPLLDIYVARSGEREIGYLPEGDRVTVLGVVAAEGGRAAMKRNQSQPKGVELHMGCEAARQIRQHARSSSKTEVCGVLIGSEVEGVTTVEASIQGANSVQAGTHVTFTQDTWEHIYRIKDRDYPDARIVGWYHSHPGFGVFLSDHDTFIHKNFFSAPQQVAWVYDPHSDEEGCFGWVGASIKRLPRIAFIDEKGGEMAGETGKPEPLLMNGEDDTLDPGQKITPMPVPTEAQAALRTGMTILSYLCVLAIGFFISWFLFPRILVVPVDSGTGQPIFGNSEPAATGSQAGPQNNQSAPTAQPANPASATQAPTQQAPAPQAAKGKQ